MTAARVAELALIEALRELAPEQARTTTGCERLGEGSCWEVFRCGFDPPLTAGDDSLSELAVLVPRRGAIAGADERVRTEARVLDFLAKESPGFRVSRVARTVDTESGVALIREAFEGRPLESDGEGSLELLGSTLGSLHRLDARPLAGVLPGFATREEHRLAAIEEADRASAEDNLHARGLTWLRGASATEGPSVLVHGDPYARNLVVDEEGRAAWIDWEFAHRGDPAYDLAVVTQGREGKRAQLLDAHVRAGTESLLSPLDILFHEVALHLRWLRQTARGPVPGRTHEGVRERLEALLAESP